MLKYNIKINEVRAMQQAAEAHRVMRLLRLPHFVENRLTDGGEVVSFALWPLFIPPPPGRFIVLISVRD
jgi:hypothetical protein